MTKTEHARRARLAATLAALGFTDTQADQLRRINSTLHRWHEMECGTDAGCIERDDDTGKPYLVTDYGNRRRRWPVADRETGARRRLSAILADRNSRSPDTLTAYIQTDPRGAALYILRPGDVPPGADAAAYYSRGICVY
jgi:hypothetical protein